ncbi:MULTISPECIES: BsuPI-related putative proteinase inhibitor [Exiguobacterium]|uniref:BsuPI-related putative proteinase inhibitor n=2 Tax=Bacillales Family XII. Incertae Sedis TaxID=539742 RepID=UPI00067FA18C|nr:MULTISPECIES: BsuPI-related putative proteinase inhibitor [Exiguobacterium]KNH36491.1 hypothetical protein ACS74_05485 [Exiguobacterium acetylicum]NTY10072.1 hypothetical protein [Exiguobacterium sp. JMULE1]
MKRLVFILLLLTVCLAGCQEKKQQATTTNEPIQIAVKTTKQDDMMQLDISLTNPNDHSVNVTYPSSQRFQAQLIDAKQHVTYDFEKEQVFTQAIEKDTFTKRETKQYTVELPISSLGDSTEVRVSTIRQFKGASAKQTTDQQMIDSK